jgi:inorganic pyrophosphatase
VVYHLPFSVLDLLVEHKTVMNLASITAWDPESHEINVIIETPKGSRNKMSYEPDAGIFSLSKVLPQGMVFPFNFGFIPSTQGDDGDPLDVLVLLEEPVPAGCKIPARLIGVIELEQKKKGKAVRNDRIIALADASNNHADMHSIDELSPSMLEEIGHFFIAYHDLDGKQVKVLGRRGPKFARKLVERGIKRAKK